MEEIKQGYKQTDIGVIPEDWEVKTVFNIAPLQRGFDLPINNISHGLHPVVFSIGILKYHNVCRVKGPGVVTGRSGTIGKLFYVPNDFWPHNTTLWVTNFRGNSPIFVYYLFNRLNFTSLATGSGVPTLNRNDIHELKIAIPNSKTEQTAIATALSDTDALITALDKKIAKKQQIKQGAIQQLLTGKKRLPGFSGEWVEKTISQIGLLTGAGVDKKIHKNEIPVLLINYLDVFRRDFIYNRELNHWVTAKSEQAINCSVKQGDIFFTPSSEMPYDIAISAVSMENMVNVVYSYHLYRLRLYEDWDLAFRTYIFKSRFFLSQAENTCEGSGKRYVISLRKFNEMKVYYPKEKSEQTAIAQILTDMDNEIAQLEKERDKYKELKAGMMQVLLMGKIRLI